jgi:UDP-GlcNAc:undecaprenyl-phosphate GlcNAc-1-phosphate transferase
MGIAPRLKVGGQLVAAAALAASDVGVKVAAGVVMPLAKVIGLHTTLTLGGSETIAYHIPLPFAVMGMDHITFDLVYWAGTAVIAVFVLGACNASNLIDGLDGLLSGTTAIASAGLLVIALGMAVADDGPRDGPRIILCLALLGACLGFLPHNFNPATIFLGDAGSLLLGFNTIVIVLMLGDQGQTKLVVAGLIIYAIPIIDTVLAIVRRKLAGKSISDADDQHLHHMLKRALGVKGAVFALYGIATVFAGLGLAMSIGRARVIYAIALVIASFVGVTAIKIARKKQLEEHALRLTAERGPSPTGSGRHESLSERAG